jgi:hypothetical protein
LASAELSAINRALDKVVESEEGDYEEEDVTTISSAVTDAVDQGQTFDEVGLVLILANLENFLYCSHFLYFFRMYPSILSVKTINKLKLFFECGIPMPQDAETPLLALLQMFYPILNFDCSA